MFYILKFSYFKNRNWKPNFKFGNCQPPGNFFLFLNVIIKLDGLISHQIQWFEDLASIVCVTEQKKLRSDVGFNFGMLPSIPTPKGLKINWNHINETYPYTVNIKTFRSVQWGGGGGAGNNNIKNFRVQSVQCSILFFWQYNLKCKAITNK